MENLISRTTRTFDVPVVSSSALAIAYVLEGWELPDDFQMPTLEELENDLALANPGWKALLRPSD